MLNTNHLLLMLADGARAAEENGERGLANTLGEMACSLAESLQHQDDVGPYRQEDLRAVYEVAGR